MKVPPLRFIAIGLSMVAAAGATLALTPHTRMSDEGVPVALERMFPLQFGAWRVDPTIVPVSVSPEVQARLDKIYNQTLARTYVNGRGERIMLSVAYGGDQSDALRAHRPEQCYANQGFDVSAVRPDALEVAAGRVPVARLMASGPRPEPITYWMTVGEQVVLTAFQQKAAQLRYGFGGRIPDGLLFRVSSISADPQSAYRLQDEFTRELLDAMHPASRARVVGAAAGASQS